MIEIHVLPGKPHINEGTSSKTGKAYRIVKQAAYALFSDGTSASFTIQPSRDSQPYPPGRYTLGPDSFYERDGQLSFTPKLIPVAGGAK